MYLLGKVRWKKWIPFSQNKRIWLAFKTEGTVPCWCFEGFWVECFSCVPRALTFPKWKVHSEEKLSWYRIPTSNPIICCRIDGRCKWDMSKAVKRFMGVIKVFALHKSLFSSIYRDKGDLHYYVIIHSYHVSPFSCTPSWTPIASTYPCDIAHISMGLYYRCCDVLIWWNNMIWHRSGWWFIHCIFLS